MFKRLIESSRLEIFIAVMIAIASATTAKESMRLTFTIFGTVTLTAAILWTVLTVII